MRLEVLRSALGLRHELQQAIHHLGTGQDVHQVVDVVLDQELLRSRAYARARACACAHAFARTHACVCTRMQVRVALCTQAGVCAVV